MGTVGDTDRLLERDGAASRDGLELRLDAALRDPPERGAGTARRFDALDWLDGALFVLPPREGAALEFRDGALTLLLLLLETRDGAFTEPLLPLDPRDGDVARPLLPPLDPRDGDLAELFPPPELRDGDLAELLPPPELRDGARAPPLPPDPPDGRAPPPFPPPLPPVPATITYARLAQSPANIAPPSVVGCVAESNTGFVAGSG